MPTFSFSIPIDDCSNCCEPTCHDRIGDTLAAVIADVEACPGFTFTGINGVFNDVTWGEDAEEWNKVVGTVTDATGGPFNALLQINCGTLDSCETLNIGIVYVDGLGQSQQIFAASFFGEGCDFPSQFDEPIDNTFTTCVANVGFNGTVTVSIP